MYKRQLINMIRQFANLGNASGIEIECDAPCTVLEGNMWQMLLKNLSGNIIFIDEENQFISCLLYTSNFLKQGKVSVNSSKTDVWKFFFDILIDSFSSRMIGPARQKVDYRLSLTTILNHMNLLLNEIRNCY